jgi:hypothetical protein
MVDTAWRAGVVSNWYDIENGYIQF